MSEIKWKTEGHKRQAETHWDTVPDYKVADSSDEKIDEHPHKGAAIYK